MFWKKKVAKNKERAWKDLLRENLNTITVDMFYGDDPIIGLGDTERRLYLKKFNDIMRDKDVMGRIIYLVNKQANMTLKSMRDGPEKNENNMAGAMNINGLTLLKDEIERLGKMYEKEEGGKDDFNKYEVIGD